MGAIASQITSLTIVHPLVYSDTDERKHKKSASLAFVRVFHQVPVNSPHKWPVTRKMFPFDDVIMTFCSQHGGLSPIPHMHGAEIWIVPMQVVALKCFAHYGSFVRGIHLSLMDSPHTRASRAELWCFFPVSWNQPASFTWSGVGLLKLRSLISP